MPTCPRWILRSSSKKIFIAASTQSNPKYTKYFELVRDTVWNRRTFRARGTGAAADIITGLVPQKTRPAITCASYTVVAFRSFSGSLELKILLRLGRGYRIKGTRMIKLNLRSETALRCWDLQCLASSRQGVGHLYQSRLELQAHL
jgi:hypothetical protein